MAIAVGKYTLEAMKLGYEDILAVFVNNEKIWPTESPDDIDMDELAAVMSCLTTGYWEDLLPWSDSVPWIDKIEIE